MVNQRVKLKKQGFKKGITNRLGTIVGENLKKTSWWIVWDGCKGRVQIKKNMLNIESNVADIVNSIFVHKLKQ